MARARNIKPGFFGNEYLAALRPETRLLFIGLWTLADREGRLEDRPMRIKGQLFPYESYDVALLLEELAGSEGDFIIRYEADGHRYIQIRNFAKHQRPHSKEVASTIPSPASVDPGDGEHQPRVTPALTLVGASTDPGDGEHALIPDTLNLIPDTLNPAAAGSRARTREGGDGAPLDIPEEERAAHRDALNDIADAWEEVTGKRYTGHDNGKAQRLMDKYPPAWIPEAIAIAGDGPERSWRYVAGVLRRFEKQGGPDSTNRKRDGPEIGARDSEGRVYDGQKWVMT